MEKLTEKVLELTRKIPKGKVTTYKIIANKLKTKAYRAVGSALKYNPHPITTPCHRVINSDFDIGFYAGIYHNPKKLKLLKEEGIEIKDNKINKKHIHYF
jgi:methylated-DNA-[protein]-cysteine S-methyltransferase